MSHWGENAGCGGRIWSFCVISAPGHIEMIDINRISVQSSLLFNAHRVVAMILPVY